MVKKLKLNRICGFLELFNKEFPSSNKSLPDSILDYIYSNIDYKIKLSEIAKKFSYSEKQIRRIIIEKTELRPKEFILSIKLKKACELLSSTDYTVDYIASTFGFASTSQFMNTFKSTSKKPQGNIETLLFQPNKVYL